MVKDFRKKLKNLANKKKNHFLLRKSFIDNEST